MQLDKSQIQELDYLEELSDGELIAVVGGAKESNLTDQLENLNPQTEVGKAALGALEALLKRAEDALLKE